LNLSVFVLKSMRKTTQTAVHSNVAAAAAAAAAAAPETVFQ
jgi:hypothetical protein